MSTSSAERAIDQIRKSVYQERNLCPGIGCRSIYYKRSDEICIGRDKTEQLMKELGLYVRKPSKYVRTTKAGARTFDNLLVEKDVTGINQVWQADMTYYIHGKKKYYIMLITDVYSQRIVGHGAYKRAFAENFDEVLRRAIKGRKREGYTLEKLIHHSDGGSQYDSTVYMKTCKRNKIKQSMCYYSWENPYAEKSNDLIKNMYLSYWKPSGDSEIVEALDMAVDNHNRYQVKDSLGKLPPIDFEKTLLSGQDKTSLELKLKPRQPRTKLNRLNLNYN